MPPPIRRTIHRVSALLETADLEFERVLNERKKYIDNAMDVSKPTETLNVDLLEAILNETFPPENRESGEEYAEFLEELFALGVATASELRSPLKQYFKRAMNEEKKAIERALNDDSETHVDSGGLYGSRVPSIRCGSGFRLVVT